MEQREVFKPREIEILHLMVEGLSNREIAGRLYIGVETVRWYAKEIYSKLAVSGRKEAAQKAQSLGLLLGQPAPPAERAQPKPQLPTPLTSFIGREKEIEEVAQLLNSVRFVTLTGPGGTGKTRLCLKIAERVAQGSPDGVYFVDLASITEAAMVDNTIAHTLGILESAGEPVGETLKRVIGQRSILLLVDNFEHVIKAAVTIPGLLSAAPNLKIIVTSREPLRVSGEQIYPVPPMNLTQEMRAEVSEAVTLFVQRAQAVQPDFRADETNIYTITRICLHLDGIPLAIELAAALARFLTPNAILTRLENRFQSLTQGMRDAPARQQTLRKTIDWSFNLLDEDEKTLLARLAVFRGGCTLEAIEAVCEDTLATNTFDSLAALVDKSMVNRLEDFNGEPRFVMLETIQEYAWERAVERGEAEILRRRHAQYFADLAAYARPLLRQAEQAYWFPRLTLEYDNLRSALQGSLLGGDIEIGLRMVDSLQEFWFYEGHHVEGQRWTALALRQLAYVDPRLQAGVLETAGMLAYAQQELQQSDQFLQQAGAIVQELGDLCKTAWILIHRAQVLMYKASNPTRQEYANVLAMCEEGIALFRTLEDYSGLAQGLNILGNIHTDQGNPQDAKAAYEECLQICYTTGERRREQMMLANLSTLAIELDNYPEAYRLACDAIRLSHSINFAYMTVLELGLTSPAALAAIGHPERAACLLGASEALQAAMNIRQQPNNALGVERVKARIAQQLGDTTYQALSEAGRKMSLEQAVTFALQELEE